MASRLRVLVLSGTRFGWRLRLATAALAALLLLGGGGPVMADEVGPADAGGPVSVRVDNAGGAVLRPERVESASRKGTEVAGALDAPDESAVPAVDHVLDQGRALLGRYGGEQVLLAVVVGALVQVLGLLLLRVVGRVFGLAARVLAWGLGAVVALSLLDGDVAWLGSADEARQWVNRLVDLIGLVV